MIKGFEFLYYCLYQMFALIKRVGEKDENLVSFFNAMLLSINILLLFLLSKFIFPLYFINLYLLMSSLFIVFFALYFTYKYYFLKKGNYIKIIANLEKKFPNCKRQMAVVGISYSLFTFLSFFLTAVYLANGTFF
jgi:hypothetical protein